MTDVFPLAPLADDGREIKAMLGEAGAAFDTAADAAAADPLLDARVDRISADIAVLTKRLDQMHRAQVRPPLGHGDTGTTDTGRAQGFVERYLRKGLERGQDAIEQKALNVTTSGEGGYAVPREFDALIETKLKDISAVRSVATVVQVGSSQYRKLVATSGFASGWAAETGARAETTTPAFAEIVPPWGELYANPAATQTMLDDAVFDVESWLADEVAREFANQEGAAFVSGNGTNRPKGFLASATATTGDATRAFGTLQYLPTTADGAFPASDPADKLIDLVHSLRPAYRQGAVFMMNTNTLARIRKFKDLEGNFLWRPSLQEGQPATLLGYPVIEAQDMPDIASGALAIAFGNFAHGYIIADRLGTRVLRDPYSNKPYVHFYTTRRTGGAVLNSEAIKLLKFSVS